MSGEVADIWTDSIRFREQIYDAIENNIDQSTTNNYDYSINFNRYEGLSEEQLRFLSTEFNGALSRPAQDLQREGDDELRQQLGELVATLKTSSEKPEDDATRLKKSWARFKGLCKAYDLSKSALELVGKIGKGVGIVIGLAT